MLHNFSVICCSAWDILRKPDVTIDSLKEIFPDHLVSLIYDNKALALRLQIEARYSDMAKKQMEEVVDVQKSESLLLPPDIPYHK